MHDKIHKKKQKYTSLSFLAEIVGGRIVGDCDRHIYGVSSIDDGNFGTITFLSNSKYYSHLFNTKASAVILDEKVDISNLPDSLCLIVVQNPYLSFAKVLEFFSEKCSKVGIEKGSFIHKTAVVGEGAYVGAFAYIGEGSVIGPGAQVYPHCYVGDACEIGAGTVLNSGVKVYSGCKVGDGCIIHSGAVIGADGFGFAGTEKVPQIGNVVIGNLVEIGANTTVDRATFGSTTINDGAKLDNLIQVAHNVSIGKGTFVAAQSGIAGSAKVGNGCVIGGQVGIAGHITLADGAKVAAQSGVSSSLESGEVVQGSPAMGALQFRRSYVGFRKLSEMEERIRELERIVKT